MKLHRLAAAIFLLGLAATMSTPEAVTLLRQEQLPALVDESRRAVLATVISVHYAFDEHDLHSTFLRLRVEDRLYGDQAPEPGAILDIKIYGAPEPMTDGSRLFLDGTPRYSIGERWLLLLREDSPWGFTNVPGLFQGAFRVTAGRLDSARAESVAGNRAVFGDEGLGRWLDPSEISAGLEDPDAAVPYSLLRTVLVRLWSEGGAR